MVLGYAPLHPTYGDSDRTFLTTNVVAQHPSNNSGLWRVLETFSQKLAKDKGKDLYINGTDLSCISSPALL
jgi:DNA/RNA endonuclease G (NUC1)